MNEVLVAAIAFAAGGSVAWLWRGTLAGATHIKPVSKGGTDDLSNLQPLQWDNNRTKSDTYPWNCA